MSRIFIIGTFILLLYAKENNACSMFYYVDRKTGKIYFVNNEDYFYDVKPCIHIIPKSKNKFARLWYGWHNFAQGGINEYGLLFDGAVTPTQMLPTGYKNPDGRNTGDQILSACQTVEEAVDFLEKNRIAIPDGHIMFGDSNGNAAVVEWTGGEMKVVKLKDNMLIATNFLLSDTTAGNYPCYRYQSIQERLNQLNNQENIDLKLVGNAMANAVQTPRENNGRQGGTLYTSFINVSDMEFILVYKLDNSKISKLYLREEFEKTHKQKIKLDNL